MVAWRRSCHRCQSSTTVAVLTVLMSAESPRREGGTPRWLEGEGTPPFASPLLGKNFYKKMTRSPYHKGILIHPVYSGPTKV